MNRQTSQFELVLLGRSKQRTRLDAMRNAPEQRFTDSAGLQASESNQTSTVVRRLIEKKLISVTLSVLAYASCPTNWSQCTIDAFETSAVIIVCSENSSVAVVH